MYEVVFNGGASLGSERLVCHLAFSQVKIRHRAIPECSIHTIIFDAEVNCQMTTRYLNKKKYHFVLITSPKGEQ